MGNAPEVLENGGRRLKRLKSTACEPDTPAGRIIAYLQRHGSASVKDLVSALGVTTNAVRQQLTQLQTGGWVTSKLCRRGVGRPYRRYLLTDEAKKEISSRVNDLLIPLYRQLAQDPNSEANKQLLSLLKAEMIRRYSETMESGTTLEGRLNALARKMEEDGLQAEVIREGDVVLLQVYACPYYSLAREGDAICRISRDAMAQVLGIPVEKARCKVDEHTFCCFRVRSNAERQK